VPGAIRAAIAERIEERRRDLPGLALENESNAPSACLIAKSAAFRNQPAQASVEACNHGRQELGRPDNQDRN